MPRLLPDQCYAMMKPPGVARAHRCPAPVLPGELYCPLHLIVGRRIVERAQRHRMLLKYARKEIME